MNWVVVVPSLWGPISLARLLMTGFPGFPIGTISIYRIVLSVESALLTGSIRRYSIPIAERQCNSMRAD